FALGRNGPLVDDRLFLAVALSDLAGPVQKQRPVEAVELRPVERPLLDVARDHGLAMTMCRKRPELAGTTPGAVAIRILDTPKHPTIGHRSLLVSSLPNHRDHERQARAQRPAIVKYL